MRATRDPDRPVRHLEWRVRLFAAGAVIALVGMYLRLDWLINVALGVLILGFGLRFVPERNGAEESDEAAG